MLVSDGCQFPGQVNAAVLTTMLGHYGVAALAVYVWTGMWAFGWSCCVGLAVWAGGLGNILISFLTLVVANASLVSVFSRLLRQIWRVLSSVEGVMVVGELFRRWALACMDLSSWAGFQGCMVLRYSRHRSSIATRES